jgi:hypothetical protein
MKTMNDLEILENLMPLGDLRFLLKKDSGSVEQKAEIRQQIFGGGRNKAQVTMVGPVIITESETVRELLASLLSDKLTVLARSRALGIVPDSESLEYLMARLLKSLPPPRWKNMEILARNVGRQITAGNKDAARYLGLSERTMRNHKAGDESFLARIIHEGFD